MIPNSRIIDAAFTGRNAARAVRGMGTLGRATMVGAGVGAIYGATLGRDRGQSRLGGAMTGAMGGAIMGRYGAAGVANMRPGSLSKFGRSVRSLPDTARNIRYTFGGSKFDAGLGALSGISGQLGPMGQRFGSGMFQAGKRDAARAMDLGGQAAFHIGAGINKGFSSIKGLGN